MATQSDLDTILAQNPTLFDDGLFMDTEAALDYYNGNRDKLSTRRTIPLDEFQASVEWMEGRRHRKDIGERTAANWKQIMERATQVYASNGAFAAAALYLNVPMKYTPGTPDPLLGFKDEKGD